MQSETMNRREPRGFADPRKTKPLVAGRQTQGLDESTDTTLTNSSSGRKPGSFEEAVWLREQVRNVATDHYRQCAIDMYLERVSAPYFDPEFTELAKGLAADAQIPVRDAYLLLRPVATAIHKAVEGARDEL